MKLSPTQPPRVGVFTQLPGPDRKRTPSDYLFRTLYKNPRPDEPGCVVLWEVRGGRLPYQVSAERTELGRLQWHCTCADAIYRGEDRDHACKHVRGLFDSLSAVFLPHLN